MAFTLAVGIGRRVPSLVQMIIDHRHTTRPRFAYFGRVRLEFDGGGIFSCLWLDRRHRGVCAADFAVDPYRRLLLYCIGVFKATFQELSADMVNSDFIKDVVDFGTVILNLVDKLVNNLGTLQTLILSIGGSVGIYKTIKNVA